jgi:hypothetical protein
MISKPFYFLLTILMGIGFIISIYVVSIDMRVFQKGVTIKCKITGIPITCSTKANILEMEYSGNEYSLLIGYSDCKKRKYAIGDSIEVRAIIGERRTQLPNDDPRIISIIIIVVVGSVFLYFLFNYKYLTTPQSKE